MCAEWAKYYFWILFGPLDFWPCPSWIASSCVSELRVQFHDERSPHATKLESSLHSSGTIPGVWFAPNVQFQLPAIVESLKFSVQLPSSNHSSGFSSHEPSEVVHQVRPFLDRIDSSTRRSTAEPVRVATSRTHRSGHQLEQQFVAWPPGLRCPFVESRNDLCSRSAVELVVIVPNHRRACF